MASAPARSAEESARTASINLRVTPQIRELIDTAAAAVGKSRTEFMLDSARRQAIDVLLDRRLFVLDAGQHDAFMKVLDNPPPPNARLRKLLASKAPWER